LYFVVVVAVVLTQAVLRHTHCSTVKLPGVYRSIEVIHTVSVGWKLLIINPPTPTCLYYMIKPVSTGVTHIAYILLLGKTQKVKQKRVSSNLVPTPDVHGLVFGGFPNMG
jgi:hypothetical protein